LGFSTTLSFTHADGDGQPVASRWAARDEVLALCDAIRTHEGTTLEYVTDGCLRGFRPDEVELMADMTLAARRPLNWNVLTIDSKEPERYREQLAANENAAAKGGRAIALTMPVLVEMNMSFLTYCALFMLPDWDSVMGLPVPERMAKLRDPDVRRFLAERARSPEAGVIARLNDWGRYLLGDTYSPANQGLKGRRVDDVAKERGLDPFDTLLDIVLADDLRTILWPLPTDSDDASWQLRKEAWARDDVLLGGSDAGAHLDRMCGAPYTTRFLAGRAVRPSRPRSRGGGCACRSHRDRPRDRRHARSHTRARSPGWGRAPRGRVDRCAQGLRERLRHRDRWRRHRRPPGHRAPFGPRHRHRPRPRRGLREIGSAFSERTSGAGYPGSQGASQSK